nr:immunoglobulin light chain junction region [Macaca mulatta]
CQQKSNWPTF